MLPSLARTCSSLALSALISWYGVRRKSLDISGGLAAVVVGSVLTAANGGFCVALLTFFFTSSKLTKWKATEKERFESDHKEGGQRNWIQVLCNGGVATIAAVAYVLAQGGFGESPFHVPSSPSLMALACICSLSCSCGDTWASEVGSIMGGTPRLITTLNRVPRGTNGGVTLVGFVCSFGGGMAVGVAYFLGLAIFIGFESLGDFYSQSSIVLLGGVAGLAGSVVDSLLGATIQYSGLVEKGGHIVHHPGHGVRHISGWDIVGNHAVNLISCLLTSILIPFFVASYWSL